jgi:hypothetical protein
MANKENNEPESFLDVFKQILEHEEVLDKVIKEGADLGSGSFSWNSHVGGTTWSPGENSQKHMGRPAGDGIGMTPDEDTKAPPILPFPMELIEEFLADAYIKIMEAKYQTMATMTKSPNVNQEQKDLLKGMHNKLSKMLNDIKKMSKDIETNLTLDK